MEGIGGHRQAAQERSGMNSKHLIQAWNKGLMRCVWGWGGVGMDRRMCALGV